MHELRPNAKPSKAAGGVFEGYPRTVGQMWQASYTLSLMSREKKSPMSTWKSDTVEFPTRSAAFAWLSLQALMEGFSQDEIIWR